MYCFMHLFSIKERAESSRETEEERGDRGLGSTPSLLYTAILLVRVTVTEGTSLLLCTSKIFRQGI
jgi:hypothetical protein